MNIHCPTHSHRPPPRRGQRILLLACLLLLGPWPAWGSNGATFSIRLQLQSVADVNVISGAGGVPTVMIGHTGTDIPPLVYVSGNVGDSPAPALQPTSQGGSTGWSMPLPRSARDSGGMVMTLVYL